MSESLSNCVVEARSLVKRFGAVTALDGEVHNAKRAEDRARAEVQDLTTARAGVAGSELPVVQARLESARKDLARVEDQLRNLAGHLGVLGTEPPQTAAASWSLSRWRRTL